MEKYLIVGLGNPGEKYRNTRHNVGFLIVDEIVSELNANLSTVSYGKMAETTYKGRKLYLLQPDTYMNLSGNAVKFWMDKLNIEIPHILILTDDLHLSLGQIRLRAKGSSAGHNGLKSIEEQLQTQNYPRLRFGIDKPSDASEQVNYVLGEWTAAEMEVLKERIPIAKDAVLSFCFHGLTNTMNAFNGK